MAKHIHLKLTPREATVLFLAADSIGDDVANDPACMGFDTEDYKAYGRAIAKLQAERFKVGDIR